MRLNGLITGPGGQVEELEMNDAVVVHAVDAAGAYLGLQPLEAGTKRVPGPPPGGSHWRWRADRWLNEPPLARIKALALREIDVAAGQRRLQYITDVPGQAATDWLKLMQAEKFLAAPGGAVPALVQAEADATQRTAAEAAQQIADDAALWEQRAAVIERRRRRGSLNVKAADTAEAVAAALQAALDALDAS